MKITGKRIRKAFENYSPDDLNTILSKQTPKRSVTIPANEKKNGIPFIMRKIAAAAAMIALLISIGSVGLMILNSRTNPQLSDAQTEPPTENLTGKPVFDTEGIKRVTFYTNYGTLRIGDVPDECIAEIIDWLETFTFREIAGEHIPPGTDTIHIEIEYADGTVIKHGMNTLTVNDLTYYIGGSLTPTCYDQIISGSFPISLHTMANYGSKNVDTAVIDAYLRNCADFHYQIIKENNPDVLSNLRNVTPSILRGKCAIYRFSYQEYSKLGGETFLVYEGNVYHLGKAFGGHGVTEFAYVNIGKADMLYYIYSWGSGMHRSHIGVFDFSTKQIHDYTDDTPVFWSNDIAFRLTGNGKILGIANAQIRNMDTDGIHMDIIKGDIIIENISIYSMVFPAK